MENESKIESDQLQRLIDGELSVEEIRAMFEIADQCLRQTIRITCRTHRSETDKTSQANRAFYESHPRNDASIDAASEAVGDRGEPGGCWADGFYDRQRWSDGDG